MMTRKLIVALTMIVLGLTIDPALAQTDSAANDIPTLLETDSLAATALDGASVEELIGDEDMNALQTMAMGEGSGLHEQLKSKFVECIERIIYLTLSEINSKKLLIDIEKKVNANDVEGAKSLCRETRGPVASICYQGLMHANEDMATVERSIVSYGTVQSGKLEKGCSWIRLMIAIAPSLGFLGTVIGMVMAFDRIQEIGDISPTIVAEGMKVALITTIFGIIVAIILQIFYNFILSRIERLTTQMEESAITLLDIIMKHKLSQG